MKLNKKQAGFSLIELILVMALSSLAFLALINYELRKADIARAEAAGDQFAEVGKALSSYLTAEQVNLNAIIPSGTTATMPITVLMGTSSGGFNGRQYLPTTWNATNIFDTNYVIQIRNTAGRFDGLVISSAAVCDKGSSLACPSPTNPIRYDWIGAAMRKMGANSGMTFNAGGTLSGFNAGWTLSSAQFPSIAGLGRIGFRVSTTDTSLYDAQYLRLDGTSIMRGNLNMGNWDIQNVTNLTANAWISTNGLLANVIQSGAINNTGNINTQNLAATNQVTAVNLVQSNNIVRAGVGTVGIAQPAGAGQVLSDNRVEANNVIQSNNNMFAMNALRTRDVYLGPTAAAMPAPSGVTLPNIWLSELLPRYVSKGIFVVQNGSFVPRPTTCTAPGVPKIEIIPQTMYMQGRVLGPISVQNPSGTSIYISQDQYSHGAYVAYATGTGPWTVTILASTYSNGGNPVLAPAFNMQGLAHVYCYYPTMVY